MIEKKHGQARLTNTTGAMTSLTCNEKTIYFNPSAIPIGQGTVGQPQLWKPQTLPHDGCEMNSIPSAPPAIVALPQTKEVTRAHDTREYQMYSTAQQNNISHITK